jgi:hypothetical protein
LLSGCHGKDTSLEDAALQTSKQLKEQIYGETRKKITSGITHVQKSPKMAPQRSQGKNMALKLISMHFNSHDPTSTWP